MEIVEKHRLADLFMVSRCFSYYINYDFALIHLLVEGFMVLSHAFPYGFLGVLGACFFKMYVTPPKRLFVHVNAFSCYPRIS